MNRFLTLILIGIIGFGVKHLFGFEYTIITLLVLIYWAIPVDTNQ